MAVGTAAPGAEDSGVYKSLLATCVLPRCLGATLERARAVLAEDRLLRLTPHELRHTEASLAIASGATVKSVQRLLGHASAPLTLDRYGHLFADELDDVAARLDDEMRENDVVPMWSRADPMLFDDEGQEA